jgi:hypothetical protein
MTREFDDEATMRETSDPGEQCHQAHGARSDGAPGDPAVTARRLGALLVVVLALVVGAAGAFAQTPAPVPADTRPAAPATPVDPIKDLTTKVADARVAVDTVWVMVAAFLVSS